MVQQFKRRGRSNCCTVRGIIECLAASMTIEQTAKKLGVSERTIWSKIRELRLKSAIKHISKHPALFEILPASLTVQQFDSVGYAQGSVISATIHAKIPSKLNPERVAEPHRFGAKFTLEGQRVWGGQAWTAGGGLVCRRWVEDEVTFIVYQGKLRQSVTVWLTAFRGLNVLAQVALGNDTMLRRVSDFAVKHGCKAEFSKKLGVREWTTTEIGRGLSKSLMDGLGIHHQGDFVELGNVRIKASDFSHPGRVEFEDMVKDVSRPLGSSDLFVHNLESLIKKAPELINSMELAKDHEKISSNVPARVEQLERDQEMVNKANLEAFGTLKKDLESMKIRLEARSEDGVYKAPEVGERREIG